MPSLGSFRTKSSRDFTLCHDNDTFPATYCVYQTATPRIYDTSRNANDTGSDWMVRSMDDETVFGVELYRKSYVEAVRNGWLSEYRIIALAINDPAAYAEDKLLAQKTNSKGKSALTSTNYLHGLAFALAMGGATQDRENGEVVIGFAPKVATLNQKSAQPSIHAVQAPHQPRLQSPHSLQQIGPQVGQVFLGSQGFDLAIQEG